MVKRVIDEEQASPSTPQAARILELSRVTKDETKFELEVTKLFHKKPVKRSYKLTGKDVQINISEVKRFKVLPG